MAPPAADELWAQLQRVTDPELDEPITDMGFVESVTVDDDGVVNISFRLPTFWCSPNFAFLMARDIRTEVEKLPDVARVRVTLQDHMYAEKINQGVNDGLPFGQVFPDMAPDEDLQDIREQFRRKAFQRRQETVLRAFRSQGYSDSRIVTLTFADFDAADAADDAAARQKARYRDILCERGLAGAPTDPAFPTYDGAALDAAGLGDYLSTLKATRLNMEFSGSLCRALLDVRYKGQDGGAGEPGLADFMPNPETIERERTGR